MADWNADPHEFVAMTDNGAGPVVIISSGADGNADDRVDFIFSDGSDPPAGGTITITVDTNKGSFYMGGTPLGVSPLALDWDTWVGQGVSWVPTLGATVAGTVTFSFSNNQGKSNPQDVLLSGVQPPGAAGGGLPPRFPQFRATGLPVGFPGVM